MQMILMGVALVGAATSVAATAQDRNSSAAIVSGDYTAAESALAAERRVYPRRPELMLNLAAVYRQTGRDAEARALYGDVLKQRDVMMDTASRRTVSSHAMARASLARLTQVASR